MLHFWSPEPPAAPPQAKQAWLRQGGRHGSTDRGGGAGQLFVQGARGSWQQAPHAWRARCKQAAAAVHTGPATTARRLPPGRALLTCQQCTLGSAAGSCRESAGGRSGGRCVGRRPRTPTAARLRLRRDAWGSLHGCRAEASNLTCCSHGAACAQASSAGPSPSPAPNRLTTTSTHPPASRPRNTQSTPLQAPSKRSAAGLQRSRRRPAPLPLWRPAHGPGQGRCCSGRGSQAEVRPQRILLQRASAHRAWLPQQPPPPPAALAAACARGSPPLPAAAPPLAPARGLPEANPWQLLRRRRGCRPPPLLQPGPPQALQQPSAPAAAQPRGAGPGAEAQPPWQQSPRADSQQQRQQRRWQHSCEGHRCEGSCQ